MKEETKKNVWATVFIVLLGIVSMCILYIPMWRIEEERKEAIKAGVARWIVDPETGVVKFVYGVPNTTVPPVSGKQ